MTFPPKKGPRHVGALATRFDPDNEAGATGAQVQASPRSGGSLGRGPAQADVGQRKGSTGSAARGVFPSPSGAVWQIPACGRGRPVGSNLKNAYVGKGRASRRMWGKPSHGRHRRCGLPESSSVTASTVRLGSNACRARWPATHPTTLVENFCLSRRCPSSLPVDPGERPAAAPVGNKALSSVPGVLLCRPFPMIFPSVRPFFRPSSPAPSASTG